MKSQRKQRVNRVSNACEQCKRRKVKCTGKNPCESCIARCVPCIFKQTIKKVLVSESYLLALENQSIVLSDENPVNTSHRELHSASPTNSHSTAVHASDATSPSHKSRQEPITNPLVSSKSFYLQDSTGRYRFCGPSSTWGFSQRVFLALKAAIPDYPSPNLPFHIDGSTWKLNWTRKSELNTSILEGLPSFDDFMHILNDIKFHSHSMLVILDEEQFFPHLNEFYEKGLEKVKESTLWFIQYLLLISLSKAHAGASSHSRSPSGYFFFERAMSLMPDFVGLHQQPNLGMRVLYLVALFLLTVDMKDAAYAYTSQSIRMCLIEGLHHEPPSEIFGPSFAGECRDIWWSAYILDRQLSAIIGAPTSIQDTEISCALPDSYRFSEDAGYMNMHIRLAKVVGQILSSVYTTENKARKSFTATIQVVLRDMAQILHDIEDLTSHTQDKSFSAISTRNCHLYLSYHQCIILATRPLFLHFLHHRLDKSSSDYDHNDGLGSSQLRPLLEISLKSAKFSLRTFSMLLEKSFPLPLFPFGLDNIFSSAFVILIAHFIDPSLVIDMQHYTNNASLILTDLAKKGNLTAELRQKELRLLQDMTKEVIDCEDRQTEGDPARASDIAQNLPDLTPDNWADGWAGTIEDLSVSETQILNIAHGLDSLTGSDLDIDFGFGSNETWF